MKFDGFDLFGDDSPPEVPSLATRFAELGRGAKLAIGGQSWEVFASQGVVKYATKADTKGRHYYEIRLADADAVEVRRVRDERPCEVVATSTLADVMEGV